MKLAIVTPTYRKKDGKTLEHLTKTLESVAAQSHTDYKVFLIGDKYEDHQEFLNISKIIDPSKMWANNLPIAKERDKYSGRQLWVSGGVYASNVGINKALEEGYDYVCHLDHDDIWTDNHLKIISDVIEETKSNFLTTRCGHGWPAAESTGYLTKWRPLPNKIFKSITCVNYRHFNIRFRNMIESENKVYASDADLWHRLNNIMVANNEWGYIINESTMRRLDSQAILRKENQ